MTILVPVDSGPLRDRVIDTAVGLAEGLDEDLYVVHLIDSETADKEKRRIRDDLQAHLADAPIPTTVALELVSHRSPRPAHRIAQEVVDIASDVDITHVVVGHRSKGLLADLAKGSTAFAVADHASVPVTIVPESAVEG
jgi:nucleotide-binding universal stress UspA family protein